MKIEESEIENFIQNTRNIVGRNLKSPFSLEDIYSLGQKLKLNGVIYLEKFDDTRHVNVLLDLNEDNITLYDPLSNVKTKPFDEIQIGMYCKLIGEFKEEFEKYTQHSKSGEFGDTWSQYKKKGKLLFDFLSKNDSFKSVYSENISLINDIPILQHDKNSSDCAPISLFVISLFNSLYYKS